MNRLLRRLILIFFIACCAVFVYVHFETDKDVDTDGPVITMDTDSIEVSVEATEEELLAGVTAEDAKDGDVTDSLIIENMTNFVDLENYQREYSIVAFDSDNNVSKVTRTLTYTDYKSPKLKMDAPLRFPANGKTTGLAEHITAKDVIDGDISSYISMTSADGSTIVSDAGTYPVEISVYNSVGDTVVVDATLEFYDTSAETVTPHVLLSDYIVYRAKGKSFSPKDYITGMAIGSVTYTAEQMEEADNSSQLTPSAVPYSMDDVKIDNPVDMNTPGTYEVTYTMEGTGGEKGTIRMVVIVH